ncbi:type II CAAX prenyl endopeptidase Rce1 family protein [Saccharicrinis sp. FJH62]|uniref:CPBP family glutamic-type intramembrane protease n=1 Tax=Saccharicrinis sp. FJH62 TaxID=3344657 RepID=UPI0035D3E285
MKQKLIDPRYYYLIFVTFIHFILNPIQREDCNLKGYEKLINTVILFTQNFLLVIVAVSISLALRPKNLGISQLENLYSPTFFFLVIAIILPLIEETAFRLYLEFRPVFLALSITVISYYYTTFGIFKTYITDINNDFLIRVSVSFSLGVIAYFLLNKYACRIKKYWDNNFKWIFYFSVLVFGLVHIMNYEINIYNLLLAPFIVLPQLISGSFYGFIRVNYGMIYGIIAHILNNTLIFIIRSFV